MRVAWPKKLIRVLSSVSLAQTGTGPWHMAINTTMKSTAINSTTKRIG